MQGIPRKSRLTPYISWFLKTSGRNAHKPWPSACFCSSVNLYLVCKISNLPSPSSVTWQTRSCREIPRTVSRSWKRWNITHIGSSKIYSKVWSSLFSSWPAIAVNIAKEIISIKLIQFQSYWPPSRNHWLKNSLAVCVSVNNKCTCNHLSIFC